MTQTTTAFDDDAQCIADRIATIAPDFIARQILDPDTGAYLGHMVGIRDTADWGHGPASLTFEVTPTDCVTPRGITDPLWSIQSAALRMVAAYANARQVFPATTVPRWFDPEEPLPVARPQGPASLPTYDARAAEEALLRGVTGGPDPEQAARVVAGVLAADQDNTASMIASMAVRPGVEAGPWRTTPSALAACFGLVAPLSRGWLQSVAEFIAGPVAALVPPEQGAALMEVSAWLLWQMGEQDEAQVLIEQAGPRPQGPERERLSDPVLFGFPPLWRLVPVQ